MTRMNCDARLADVYNGEPGYVLPTTLKAVLIGKSPGPDGTDWSEADIISKETSSVTFDKSSGRCRNSTPLAFELVTGVYPQAVLCFLDEEDIVVAFGGVRPCGSSEMTGSLVANIDDIEIRLVRPV